MKNIFPTFVFSMLFTAAVAAPQVSNVAMSYEGSGAVKITYDLEGEPGIVLLDVKSGDSSIGDTKIAHAVGDVNRKISPGTGKTIWWSCSKESLGVDDTASLSAVVTAYSLDNPPEVLVLDLANTNGYMFYKSLAALPDGGLANDIYRTSRLVMKKVPAKGVTFLCGMANRTDRFAAFLAKFDYDYYLGIYPVTQGQQLLIDGNKYSKFTDGEESLLCPVDSVAWSPDLRWWTGWPNSQNEFKHESLQPNHNCILTKLRQFGLLFDLPTSTEWEYACRAGTQRRVGNGTDDETGMARMAWYSDNADGKTHPVGRKDPNDWGFYDMHGNVSEWCLDQYRGNALPNRDVARLNYPGEVAATENFHKVIRGGSYASSWDECSSHVFNKGQYQTTKCGYRVCVKAVIP